MIEDETEDGENYYDETYKLWELHNKEFLKFYRIKDKHSQSPDLHAFIMLDKLFPDKSEMVNNAHHDEIVLRIDVEQIEQLTEDQVIELIRCGIHYDPEIESLCMFT